MTAMRSSLAVRTWRLVSPARTWMPDASSSARIRSARPSAPHLVARTSASWRGSRARARVLARRGALLRAPLERAKLAQRLGELQSRYRRAEDRLGLQERLVALVGRAD